MTVNKLLFELFNWSAELAAGLIVLIFILEALRSRN